MTDRLVLDEEFLYDDGERASRIWTIDRLGSAKDGTVSYSGRAADVKVAAHGAQVGNALNWQYDITLEMSGMNLDVHFDDWIYKQDEDIAINRAFVTKFGVEIGSVTIVFIRGKTASNLWPLALGMNGRTQLHLLHMRSVYLEKGGRQCALRLL